MKSRKAKLAEGSVGRHLVKMTVPMLIGITTMMAQGIIDAWFLGKVGDSALAAFSFGFPILMIITSVAIGLSAGTSSVVARAIGADDHRRAKRLATDSLMLSFIVTATLAGIGILTIDPLFKVLGAPVDMIPLIRGFMTILYSGIPFLVVGMVGTSNMRATGDTLLPGKLMIAGAFLNIILDPILIFGVGPIPALGLNGAAIAALLARGAMFVGTIYFLVHRLDMVSFNRPDLDELKKSWRDILHVGLPAAGTNAIIPVAMTLITAMIARYGPDAVAGFGVASRIESLVLVIFYALSSVIGPFVGQNLSAGKESRIHESLRLTALFCMGSGLVIALLLAVTADALPTLFSQNPDVQWYGETDARGLYQYHEDAAAVLAVGSCRQTLVRHCRHFRRLRRSKPVNRSAELRLGKADCTQYVRSTDLERPRSHPGRPSVPARAKNGSEFYWSSSECRTFFR